MIVCSEQSLWRVRFHQFVLHMTQGELRARTPASLLRVHYELKADLLWQDLLGHRAGAAGDRWTPWLGGDRLVLWFPRARFLGLTRLVELVVFSRLGTTLWAKKLPLANAAGQGVRDNSPRGYP